MPTIRVQLESPVRRTFRVEQVAGMFDVPVEALNEPCFAAQNTATQGTQNTATLSAARPTAILRHELVAEVPGVEEKWTIGAIVGPSGSGKTTLARAAFGGCAFRGKMFRRRAWPKDRAIIDYFPDTSFKDLTCVLASVGLGSPPTWLKPYRVLSEGERFRAELARAVMSNDGILTQRHRGTERVVVFDEFTSSLDRTIAKTTSAALARLLREGEVGRRSASLSHPTVRWPRFVAVTCHRDILPWLSPDWVVELGGEGGGRLSWPAGRPPHIRIRVERVPQAMWARFSGEHYLSGGLAASATCYGAMWAEEEMRNSECGVRSEEEAASTPHSEFRTPHLVAFCAVAPALGWKATKRIQRLVVLPEFQGLGIGGKLLNEVAGIEANKGNRVTITASHPAVLAHCERSERWQLFAVKKDGSTRQRYEGREVSCSVGRAVAAFEFLG